MNTIVLPIANARRSHLSTELDRVDYRLARKSHEFSREAMREGDPLLLLGGMLDLSHIDWHSDPELPCSAVLLVGNVSAAELSAALQKMPDQAVPIADFCGNHGIRTDFCSDSLNEASVRSALDSFTPILRRLAATPNVHSREQRADSHALRMSYSRDCPVEAVFNPELGALVDYPLLGEASSKRLTLEGLALRGLLRRRHFIRTHTCADCASHRLLAFEACHGCGGSDLVDEPLVHHYRCGCQQPESSFVQGNTLVCPKCRRSLRHFGMDYGKPGSVVHCRSCGNTAPEPDPSFVCLDCSKKFGGRAAKATDWFHYDLTEAGVSAVLNGMQVGETELRAEADPALCSMREFQLLAGAALRHARKASLPIGIARCAPADLPGWCEHYGQAGVKNALNEVARHIAASLSDGEFVTCIADSVLVGFSEWGDSRSKALLEAGCANATIQLENPCALKIEAHVGAAAERLLGLL